MKHLTTGKQTVLALEGRRRARHVQVLSFFILIAIVLTDVTVLVVSY
jgi:hypothetical protein